MDVLTKRMHGVHMHAMLACLKYLTKIHSVSFASNMLKLLCTAHAQDFLEAKGVKAEDGRREDPQLPAFEEQIHKYKYVVLLASPVMSVYS